MASRPTKRRGLKAERILRLLLEFQDSSINRNQLATKAKVTSQYVYKLLKRLEAGSMIHGMLITDLEAYIKEWQRLHVPPSVKEYHLNNPEKSLVASDLPYALTGSIGENLSHHLIHPDRWDIYIRSRDQLKWSTHLISAGGLIGRGNTRILVHDDHVISSARKIGPHRVVLDSQLFFDLWFAGGVGRQGAEHLAERRGWSSVR